MNGSMIELLTKLLAKFGPFAVCAVAIVFLGYLFKKGQWKKVDVPTKIGISFIFVIVLFFSLLVWYKMNFPEEYVINGKLENIMSHEKILSDDLYLRRDYIGSEKYFNYDWKLITPKKLTEGGEIRFTFDKSQKPEEENVDDYKITFKGDCSKRLVKIIYKRERDEMMCEDEIEGVRVEKIIVKNIEDIKKMESPSKTSDTLFCMAFAMDMSQLKEEPRTLTLKEKELIRWDLESRDVLIRRRARSKLTFHITRNVDFINELLQSESFWLKLGALRAIKHVEVNKVEEIRLVIDIEQIIRLSEDENETLRKMAQDVLSLLRTHGGPQY